MIIYAWCQELGGDRSKKCSFKENGYELIQKERVPTIGMEEEKKLTEEAADQEVELV